MWRPSTLKCRKTSFEISSYSQHLELPDSYLLQLQYYIIVMQSNMWQQKVHVKVTIPISARNGRFSQQEQCVPCVTTYPSFKLSSPMLPTCSLHWTKIAFPEAYHASSSRLNLNWKVSFEHENVNSVGWSSTNWTFVESNQKRKYFHSCYHIFPRRRNLFTCKQFE